MFDLFKTLSVHKKTVLFNKGGFNVNCILKPDKTHKGFSLSGFSTFTGCTFTKDGEAFFGDLFELTINLEDVFKHTNEEPKKGWFVSVEFPQIQNKKFDFLIEQAPIDRLIGTALLRCSAIGQDFKSTHRAKGGI